MIEDMEECALGARLADKILDVVENEHVDALVEVDEVVDTSAAQSRGILALEKARRHIQHPLLRVELLDAYADGLYQMGLADAGRAEYEERVESLAFGIRRDGLADRTRHAVAHSDAIVLESVARIELGVYLYRLRLGSERIGRGSRSRGDSRRRIGTLHRHGGRRVVGNLIEMVKELHRGPVDLAECLENELEVALFKLLNEELRRHPDVEVSVDKADRSDRFEPSLELLFGKIILENCKTILPHLRMVLLHLFFLLD